MLPESWKLYLEKKYDESIIYDELLSMDEVKSTHKVSIAEKSYFIKIETGHQSKSILDSELDGLKNLDQKTNFKIPQNFGVHTIANQSILVLDWIERGQITQVSQVRFGKTLAEMHKQTETAFGWHENNYIASINQDNKWSHDWINFYIYQRIEPLIKSGTDNKIFEVETSKYLSRLEKTLTDCMPDEPPALIHGDLWSGNYIVDSTANTYLIDPAMYYGHREMDLAMSLLFGGFGRQFYKAYSAEYPLTSDFESRMQYHQLYPNLVHANLFGGHYIQKVISTLKSSQ